MLRWLAGVVRTSKSSSPHPPTLLFVHIVDSRILSAGSIDCISLRKISGKFSFGASFGVGVVVILLRAFAGCAILRHVLVALMWSSFEQPIYIVPFSVVSI